MSNVHLPRGWEVPESRVTDEQVYWNRRKFLKASLGAAAGLYIPGCSSRQRPHESSALESEGPVIAPEDLGPLKFGIEHPDAPYPTATPNPAFVTTPERPLAKHQIAAAYNNFYEFSSAKKSVWKRVGEFRTHPWKLEVGGLAHKPQTFDLDDLFAFAHEERIYRHRCVEAWAMVVPWCGFPLRTLLERVEPMGTAKFVRFETAHRPEQFPRVKATQWYPWPYHEALRIDEATNDLAMLVTGMYGKALPRQNGAPVRLVVPWKYGYKSIKSIVKIELVAEQPTTFWNTLEPDEYSFLSNVEPTIPHPRWSQEMERDIQTDEKHPTLRFNGYGEFVADMYP